MATTSPITTLDPTFTSLINSLMEIERQPLTRLTQQRDSVSLQKGIYNDLKKTLDDLQSAARSLKSSDPFCTLSLGNKVNLANVFITATGAATTATVASFTTNSGAVPGAYTLKDVTLAKAHTLASNQQEYADQALNLSGGFILGGAATRTVSVTGTANATVTGFGTGELAAGQTELGSGPYYIETRLDPASGAWQFRLVNEDGTAASIRMASGTSFTSGWQAIPTGAGAYDTGRGLTITFGADPSAYSANSKTTGAVQAVYTAQGAAIQVSAGDSLIDIASKINREIFAEGNGVTATVVDNQLILTSKSTGVNHAILVSDTAPAAILQTLGILDGTGFLHESQTPSDAQFTLNNMVIHRSQNANLSNVVSGVTINLAPDAEGKTATLSITSDPTGAKDLVNGLITKFNSLQSYLSDKIAVTKQADGTYKRGALAGDMMFTSLRNDLFNLISGNASNDGTLTNLREVGLTLNDNMQLAVSDATKLENALQSDFANVSALFDKVMSGIDAKLGYYTGSNSYVESAIESSDRETETLNDKITTMNQRLDVRKQALTEQYAQLQTQLLMMQYTQQQMSLIYGSVNQYA
ncbi:MAG: flagellar filament capping protein FliD [Chloroflexi bacterium]|nr:flagellar filament capping protein FliD [Chloroflexota bacterium]